MHGSQALRPAQLRRTGVSVEAISGCAFAFRHRSLIHSQQAYTNFSTFEVSEMSDL